MKNLKVQWSNSANASGVDENHIYRADGDHTAMTDMALFRSHGTQVGTVTAADAEFIDVSVASGDYTYGVFSHNSVGYGPGDLANSVYTVGAVSQTGPTSLTSSYTISPPNPAFLQWQYSNGSNNNANWIANSASYNIPAAAMGGYHISTSGITSIYPYAGARNVRYVEANRTYDPVPLKEVYNSDLSVNLPNWTFGSTTMFFKLPIPFFDNSNLITHFPLSVDSYYPAYSTEQEALDRLTLYNLPTGSQFVKQVTHTYLITDPSVQYYYTDSGQIGMGAGAALTQTATLYLPELPLADVNTPFNDFSKRWDPDVTDGLAHDDSGFPVVDSGVLWQGQMYNYDGTPRV